MSEAKRGCGWRKIGGLYLVSDLGFQLQCDGLPLELEPCGCCGFKPPFSRNLQRIQPEYLLQAERKKHGAIRSKLHNIDTYEKKCTCPGQCPLCHPNLQEMDGHNYGLMFVGKQSYTPESFIKEAFSMGVSKRIPEIPSWLMLGKTWIVLAHQKVPKELMPLHSKMYPDLQFDKIALRTQEPTEFMAAIFYAFKPQRVEMPVWKGDLSDAEIQKLDEQGITPVLLDKTPESIKKHKHAKNMQNNINKYLKPNLKKKLEGGDEE